MSKPEKILHVLNSRVYSGAEAVAAQIIRAFSDRAELGYCSPESEEVSRMLQSQGIRHVRVKTLTPWSLARVIRREKPDIIHAHDMRSCFYAALSCGKIPLLFHIHNNAMDARRIGVKSVAFGLASLRAKHIFWVSPGALHCYRFGKAVAKKSSVLRNVVDTDALFRKLSADPEHYGYDIVFCGRLAPEKDPLRFLRVCALVKKEKPDLRAAVIGDGELEEDCRRLARELGLTDQVSFLGYRPNPVKILHDSTLIALTSLWEGCGLVVMEAMALGTPAVCTDVDGLRGILLDGETGFYGRTDGELADAMVRILRDPRLRASLSERGRAHFEAINDPESYYRVLSEHYGL